jgi:hypothetical protein
MPEQKIYTDKDLIRYGDTIRLHFDQQGKTAWLTLENYGSAGHRTNVIRVTLGAKVRPAYKATISIGGMLSCAQIDGFQRAVIARTTGKESFSRKELTDIVAENLKTPGFYEFVMGKLVPLRKFTRNQPFRGCISFIKSITTRALSLAGGARFPAY